MDKLRPITLVDQVVEKTTEYIQTNQLGPGDALPSAAALAERFSVSRSVIREALKSLEAHGIVSISNGKRVTVGFITHEPLIALFSHAVRMRGTSVREFMEIRRGLEIDAAGSAAIRHTEKEMEKIRNLLAEMRRQLYDVDRFSQLDAEFHIAIAEATHNKMLLHLLVSIRHAVEVVSRAGRLRRLTPGEVNTVQELHDQIVEGMASRDATRARLCMEKHFDHVAMTLDTEISLSGDDQQSMDSR